jgi:hypothetical protein
MEAGTFSKPLSPARVSPPSPPPTHTHTHLGQDVVILVVAAVRPLILPIFQCPVHIGSEGRQAHKVQDTLQRLRGRLEEVVAV